MMEKITSAQPECIHDAPFSNDSLNGFKQIGGNVQLNFQYRDEGVLHIAPISSNLSEAEKLICERWICTHKAFKLARIQRIADSLHPYVKVPPIQIIGEVISGENKHPFWLDAFVSGNSLSQLIFTDIDSEIYKIIMIWMARLHHIEDGDVTLIDYYRARLAAFSSLLNDDECRNAIGSENVQWLLDIIEVFNQDLYSIVATTEKVSLIHGDLRGDNVLVNQDSRIIILDFEQGANGGDWYCDIAKLLIPDSGRQPDPKKRYLYTPPFDLKTKQELVKAYVEERQNNGWKAPAFICDFVSSGNTGYIEQRDRLHNLDNMISFLIMRYLSGWNFSIDPVSGRRGIGFIIDSLKAKYGN